MTKQEERDAHYCRGGGTVIRAYWYGDYVLPHGDGRPVAIGTTHTVEPPIVPCERGLHASRHPLDALRYARCSQLWFVDCGGEVVEQDDKLACSERTYLACIDSTPILRTFARWCALSVAHLWDMPVEVRQYLETGDESFRAEAERMSWAARAKTAKTAEAAEATWAAAVTAGTWAVTAARAAARATAARVARVARVAAEEEQRAEFFRLVDAAFAREVYP